MAETISALRKKIDSVDDEIADLFLRRLGLATEIARIKDRKNMPLGDQTRKNEILNRLKEKFRSGETTLLALLFERIFELTETHQASDRDSRR